MAAIRVLASSGSENAVDDVLSGRAGECAVRRRIPVPVRRGSGRTRDPFPWKPAGYPQYRSAPHAWQAAGAAREGRKLIHVRPPHAPGTAAGASPGFVAPLPPVRVYCPAHLSIVMHLRRRHSHTRESSMKKLTLLALFVVAIALSAVVVAQQGQKPAATDPTPRPRSRPCRWARRGRASRRARRRSRATCRRAGSRTREAS